jgi:hypothetical protein
MMAWKSGRPDRMKSPVKGDAWKGKIQKRKSPKTNGPSKRAR